MTTINVVLTDLWLTDVTDPGNPLHASFVDRSSTVTLAGSVRTYAGNRRRIITTPADTAVFPLTLQLLSAADVATLTRWRGKVLLLRDTSARRVFGTFMALDVKDTWAVAGPAYDASLTFTQVDYVEGV